MLAKGRLGDFYWGDWIRCCPASLIRNCFNIAKLGFAFVNDCFEGVGLPNNHFEGD